MRRALKAFSGLERCAQRQVSSGKLLESLPHDVHVNYASVRSDGLLCSCADDGKLRFFGGAPPLDRPRVFFKPKYLPL